MNEVPLFSVGWVVVTQSAWQEIKTNKANVSDLLERHVSGDWSEMTKEEGEENRAAIESGREVFSSYILATETFKGCEFHTKVWIITEGDRSITMILLPKEYDAIYA
jgi:hypothetical protein